jgi:hypothetical protein
MQKTKLGSVITKRQGFTTMGFSKSGFSCCSQWKSCNYGKNGCVLSSIDEEAAEFCHCYQRNNQIIKNLSTEIDDLFNSVNYDDINAVLQAVENREYLGNKEKEIAGLSERVKQMEQEEIQTLSTMCDYDVLLWTVKDWVRMSSSTKTIERALDEENIDKAFREFKRMINESGSGGRMISYFKFYKTIEIKTKDSRYFTPTEKELWDIYYSAWKEENTLNLFNF